MFFFQQLLRRDAHCHQFLHQQLASVGHFNGVDVFAFARDAVQLPTVVRNDGADQAAVFADGGVVGIGGQHHPFVQHRRCSGSNAAIPFHFAPSQSAPVGSTVHGLPSQSYDFPLGSGVYFVRDHVLQFLIKSGPNEHSTGQAFAGVRMVHDFLRYAKYPEKRHQ